VNRPVRVGELRPSQLLHTFGIGAVVDLPSISALVQGLDEWAVDHTEQVHEPRLLAAVRDRLGQQVATLRLPPYTPDDGNPFSEEAASVGVPVATFPRWLRCPRCAYLGPVGSGLFELKREPFRPDRVRYEHPCTTRGRNPVALPVRFLVACRSSHLDDFAWELFVHRGLPCDAPLLELRERGVTGEAADVFVRCRPCGQGRSMAEAFGQRAEQNLPRCRGRHPHLGVFGDCDQPLRTILLGASNLWFADAISVLHIPSFEAPLAQKVAELWELLEPIRSAEVLAYARATQGKLAGLAGFGDGAVLDAIEAHRRGTPEAADGGDPRADEWAAFADPGAAPTSEDFRLRARPAPASVRDAIAQVVLAERLREVNALVGFTRIDPPGERLDEDDPVIPRAPLARRDPVWVPCAEVRGEGVFVRLDEEAVRAWEDRVDDDPRLDALFDGHRGRRHARGLPPDGGFPGARFVLLHTLAHALIRIFALEAGYAAASLRERLYAARQPEPMAGVLIYTAATDSEGTLGGLVRLGEPDTLVRLLARALDDAGLCSADPMCAEHDPSADNSTHGAACHACLFASETSCERGNRYLDRALLVDTFTTAGLGYFRR
jgi:hypothetical protein